MRSQKENFRSVWAGEEKKVPYAQMAEKKKAPVCRAIEKKKVFYAKTSEGKSKIGHEMTKTAVQMNRRHDK